MGSLCLITGPPGAGKTTVAREVAIRVRGVHIHGDDFWHYIVDHIDPWLEASADQNATVMEAIAAAAAAFAVGGYPTVVDTVIGPWFLDPFVRAAASAGAPLDYVVLRPREDVAWQRTLSRASGGLADELPIRKVYRDFADLKEFESHVIDSSDMTAEEAIGLVLDGLRSGRFHL